MTSAAPRVEIGVSSSSRAGGLNDDIPAARRFSDRVVLILADGAGGLPDATRVAREAANSALAVLSSGDPVLGLLRLGDAISSALRRAEGLDRRSATALAACVIAPQGVHVVSFGDCRASRLDGLGAWLALSPTGANGERGPNGTTERLPGWLPSRAPVEALVTSTGPLLRGERIVLTSDGVHDFLTEPRMAELAILEHLNSASVALTSAAIDAGSGDDATAVIAQCTGHDPELGA